MIRTEYRNIHNFKKGLKMKKSIAMLFGAAALFAAGTLSAQVQELNKAADWNKNKNVTDGDGCLNVSKRVLLTGKKFTVDPEKAYTLKVSAASLKAEGKDTSWCLAGFAVFDKDGRPILPQNNNAIAGTFTEVTADAAKGSQVLMVKDGSKIRKAGHMVLVAGAKEDFSDLPNRNSIAVGVADVQKKDDAWEITLVKPLVKEVKAGTMIREHAKGGYLYTAGSRNVGNKWSTMQGKISGFSKFGWAGNKWPAGTASARIVILVNWSNKKLETQLKDISLTVEDAAKTKKAE